VSTPEAHAPSAARHAPTLTRPRWGREPAVSEWLSLSQAGSSGERAGGARSQGNGRLVQVASTPEARAPSAARHAPTLTRPRWGREPAGAEWLSLSRAGSSGEHPGGARSLGMAGWCRWRACRRRALPGEWQALVPQYDT
jgi:hypothetical protein